MNKTASVVLSKVPEVTLVFWIIKIAATTLGETGGDTVTMTLNWGYLAGTALFLRLLVVLVDRADPREEVSSLPLLGDHRRLHHLRHDHGRFRRPLARHRLHRRLDAAARLPARGAGPVVLVARHRLGRTRSSTPKVEAFYWAAITFSQTLGTALGDWMADTGGARLRRRRARIRRRAAAVAAAYFWTNVSRVLLFWAAFILTRPLGATVGDFLDKPVSDGGLA